MKIKDICEYGAKSKIKAGDGLSTGEYKLFTSSSEVNKYINEKQFDKPGIIMGTGGNATLHYCDEPFSVSTDCLVLFPSKLIKPKFLYYFFKGNIHILQQGFKGAGLKHTSKKYINEIQVNQIPDIERQQVIINILDKVSSIAESKKLQIEEYDQLIKSRFVEMFGDPVVNNKNWKQVNLKKLTTKVMSGNTPKGGSQVYVNDGILFFRSQNVWKNRIELDDIAYIDEETHKKMSRSSLKHKDILMTKTGRMNTKNSSLGRAAMYLGEDGKANINGHVYLIRLNEVAAKEFVLFILTTIEYRDYIRSVCVGGIDKRQLNKNHIEEFPIILPPRKDQDDFVSLINQVDKLKFEYLI